uniref:Uncharacterized protein n=1 Tax=Lotharella globosa TaxID=91324 RepID=A0A7S3Z5R2_9EUKA
MPQPQQPDHEDTMGMQRLLLLLLPFAHASTLASLAHSRIQRGCSPAAASATRRPLASAASVVSPKDNAIHGYLSRGLRPLVRRSQRGRTTTAAISRVGAGAAAAAASSTVATAATASADAAAKATTAGTAVYDREFPQVVDEQMTMEQNG